MEKPIIVTISRNSPDDLVEILDEEGKKQQQLGLSKLVAVTYLDGTFQSLCEYMLNSQADEYNKQYSDGQTSLAKDIELLIAGKNIEIYARRNDKYDDSLPMRLEDRVNSFFPQIVTQKEIEVAGQKVQYKSIDLCIKAVFVGGWRAYIESGNTNCCV